MPGAGGPDGDQSSAGEDPMLEQAAEDQEAEVGESVEVTGNSYKGLEVVSESDSPEDDEPESAL